MSTDPFRPPLPVREPASGAPNGSRDTPGSTGANEGEADVDADGPSRIPFPTTTRSSVYFGRKLTDDEEMDQAATPIERPRSGRNPGGDPFDGDDPVDAGLFDAAMGGAAPPGGPSGFGGDDDDNDDDDDDLVELRSNATRNALEWAVVLVGAVLVALVLRAALFQAFWIPSESMETTLLINDRVLVNKLSYHLHDVHRGDVVVFVRRDDEPGEYRDLIKRVIGTPGDTVEGRDNVVYVNGATLVEPYLDPGITTSNFGPVVVPENQIFVMGDNRNESYDSRNFGTVDEDRIVGRAFVLFWPVNRVGWL